jgi:predicted nucleic acid-binding protein
LSATLVFVSDTNIWIDFDRIGLLNELFALPFQYCTTDFAAEELQQPNAEDLIKRGLAVKSTAPETVLKIQAMFEKYSRPSLVDISCLVLAEETGCKLLTGDQALRNAAENEGNVVVHGTLWLLDQMVLHKTLTRKKAAVSLQLLLDTGARLPVAACEERMKKWTA